MEAAPLGLGWLAESALANLFDPVFAGLNAGPVLAHAISATLVFAIIMLIGGVLALGAAVYFACRPDKPESDAAPKRRIAKLRPPL